LRRTTLSEVLQGRLFPRKAILLTFVEACGVDLETDRQWEQAWDRLAEDRDQTRETAAGQRARKIKWRTSAQTEQLTTSASAPAAGALRMDPIRVLIADGHALFRRGLEMVFETEDDIDLVGQASDGAEAVAVAAESQPDVVLMDVRMPRISGIEACRAIREIAPSAKIVMLTISDEQEDLFEAIRAGASGYLLKDIPPDEVAEAVLAVHGGQSVLNPSIAGKLLTEFATVAKQDAEAQHVTVPMPKLTEREMEVLKLVARGMNNRDIAKELFISEATVKNHVRNILEKLQIHSRMEAVMIATPGLLGISALPGG